LLGVRYSTNLIINARLFARAGEGIKIEIAEKVEEDNDAEIGMIICGRNENLKTGCGGTKLSFPNFW